MVTADKELSDFAVRSDRRSLLYSAAIALGIAAVPRIFAERQQRQGEAESILQGLKSPEIFAGDERTAYRDPAAIYHSGWFYLYFTLVRTESDGVAYSYVAWVRSRDLQRWSEAVILTPRDKNLDFGSPGDIVRFEDRWLLCLQTYPRPHGEK